MTDAFNLNGFQIGRAAESQRRENGQLVGAVMPVDIGRGIGLGIAKLLRFAQRIS